MSDNPECEGCRYYDESLEMCIQHIEIPVECKCKTCLFKMMCSENCQDFFDQVANSAGLRFDKIKKEMDKRYGW